MKFVVLLFTYGEVEIAWHCGLDLQTKSDSALSGTASRKISHWLPACNLRLIAMQFLSIHPTNHLRKSFFSKKRKRTRFLLGDRTSVDKWFKILSKGSNFFNKSHCFFSDFCDTIYFVSSLVNLCSIPKTFFFKTEYESVAGMLSKVWSLGQKICL